MQIVLVLVGGLLTLIGVVAGALINERFQRRRDAITHVRHMAEIKRAYLSERYVTIMLAANRLLNVLIEGQVRGRLEGINPALDEFSAAFMPLTLEYGQRDVGKGCVAFLIVCQAYVEAFPNTSEDSLIPVQEALATLRKTLGTFKRELDKIP